MISFVKKIVQVSQNRTTYRVGLLQDKVYRILKKHTSSALEKYCISTVEWAYLGLLHDNPAGIRLVHIAKALEVEPPFVTDITNKFLIRGASEKLVVVEADPKDKRAKLVKLSVVGHSFVNEVEVYLREKTKPLLADISPGDLLGYLSVLSKIVENSNEKHKSK